MQSEAASVIWVGPGEGEAYERVAADLRGRGLPLAVCEDTAELAKALRRRSRAVVVVRDSGGASLADAALAAVESVYRPVPVVVLADEAAFSRYYELMGRGVRHYCDLSEAPERIARVVRHTAASAA